jgi:hypothetical protein
VPVVFDFEKPKTQTSINTITSLARMARFVIADISNAKSVLQELQARFAPGRGCWPSAPTSTHLSHCRTGRYGSLRRERCKRRVPHSAPQARIDRPVDKRRAPHPLPLPRLYEEEIRKRRGQEENHLPELRKAFLPWRGEKFRSPPVSTLAPRLTPTPA